jgi:multidrug efflux pump subunit AcrB
MPKRKPIVSVYLISVVALAALCFIIIGKDLLPKTNNGQLQIRIREPEGTRLEKTERTVRGIMNILDTAVHGNIAVSSAYVGLVPVVTAPATCIFSTAEHMKPFYRWNSATTTK